MQIRKKWLNQLKDFFNKHFWEYYLSSFYWWISLSCENHCNLMHTHNRDGEKSSGQATQFSIWTVWATDRTSAQPYVNLSMLSCNSLKFQPQGPYDLTNMEYTLQRYYTENSKRIFPKKELRGHSPNSYTHTFCVRFIYSHHRGR